MARNKNRKRSSKVTHRNLMHAATLERSWGAGNHGDKKKARAKKACRKKVKYLND